MSSSIVWGWAGSVGFQSLRVVKKNLDYYGISTCRNSFVVARGSGSDRGETGQIDPAVL